MINLPKELECVRGSVAEFPTVPPMVIYFLFWNETLVYIGQSKVLGQRLQAHRGTLRNFERAFFMAVRPEDATALERALILRFMPRWNLKAEWPCPRGGALLSQYGFGAGEEDAETLRHKFDTKRGHHESILKI